MKEELIKIGDKTYKEAHVIILKSEQNKKLYKGQLWTHNNGGVTKLHLWTSETIDVSIHELLGYCIPQHLYIVTSEQIKEGDWYIHKQIGEYRISNSNAVPMDAKKIIASTDLSLIAKEYDGLDEKGQKQYCNKYLPRPSSDFIQRFCELNGDIKDVLVEYEGIEWLDKPLEYFIKVSPDNTISIIKKVKDSLKDLCKLNPELKEQVVQFIKNFYPSYQSFKKGFVGNDDEIIDKWIEKNL